MSSLQHVNPRVRGIRVSPHSLLQSLAANIAEEVAQVLSVCLYPQLLQDRGLPLDVKARAQRLLEACDGGSVGSYSESSGLPHIRRSIAEFISRRDAGVPSHTRNVFISAGSQRALMIVVRLMAGGEGGARTGVLTPTPCPHTLPPAMDEAGVNMVPYQLTEEQGWAVDPDELRRAVESARGRCAPRAIYISNPGNPTGHVQDRKSIEEVIRFAAAEKLILLVDEVFQDSVYGPDTEFVSYKKVLFDMGKTFSQTVELISFHCLSSACMSECGLRAGYMEIVNMDPEVMAFVDTMLCGDISAPVTGQLALQLMIDPPKPRDPSYDAYTQDTLLVRTTLSQNARRVWHFLKDLPGMSCQPAFGGIYLYPHLRLPREFIEQAKALELEADALYCQQLLEEEGVFAGAGCQLGGSTGNHHLRLCVLVPPDTLQEVLARLGSFHLRLMARFPLSN